MMQTPCSSLWPLAQLAARAVAAATGALALNALGVVAAADDATVPYTAAPARRPKAAPLMTVVRGRIWLKVRAPDYVGRAPRDGFPRTSSPPAPYGHLARTLNQGQGGPTSRLARVLYGRGMGDRSQSITIRSTMESDWPQIRGLRIENATDNRISYGATLHTTRRMNVDAWRLRGRRGEGPDTASLAAIDTKTGRWVGMMSGQLGDEDGPQAVLTGVYVSSDYRGRQCGIADALLDEVEDWACRTSDRLRLFVYENSPRAIGFYRRRDFRETGRRRAIALDPGGHTLEMVKTLRAPNQ